jgi:hypothetical protein
MTGDHERALYLLNEVAYALEAKHTSTADLERWLSQLDESRALLSRGGDMHRAQYIAMTYHHIAAIRILQSRLDDAAHALMIATTHVPHNSARWELHGIVRALRGDSAGAREAFHRALETAHPDALIVARLGERLRRLDRR